MIKTIKWLYFEGEKTCLNRFWMSKINFGNWIFYKEGKSITIFFSNMWKLIRYEEGLVNFFHCSGWNVKITICKRCQHWATEKNLVSQMCFFSIAKSFWQCNLIWWLIYAYKENRLIRTFFTIRIRNHQKWQHFMLKDVKSFSGQIVDFRLYAYIKKATLFKNLPSMVVVSYLKACRKNFVPYGST